MPNLPELNMLPKIKSMNVRSFIDLMEIIWDNPSDYEGATNANHVARHYGAMLRSRGMTRDGEPGYSYQFPSYAGRVFVARNGGMVQEI